METAKLALKLKSEGLSFRAIADRFNSESIPTPSGNGKWGHEQIKRLIAVYAKNKAEVKVGLVSENEVRLKEEVETLRSQLEQVSELILERNDEIKQLKSVISEIHENNRLKYERVCKDNETFEKAVGFFRSENERLESELGFEVVDRGKLQIDFNYLKEELATVTHKLSIVTENKDFITTQKNSFKAEAERLQRSLSEAELKFKNQYESEITRLGSELAAANQTMQELSDKQSFLSVESVVESEIPKNYKGWTTQTDQRGYIRLFKKMSGKLHQFYFGRNWDASVADRKIGEYTEKNLDRLKFAIRKDADEQLPVPMAFRFEDSLRLCCPEQRRTYRLDKIRQRFPGMQKSEFDRNMLSLASQYKIELVGGDPRECDMDALIRDDVMGITYVNFEWRA